MDRPRYRTRDSRGLRGVLPVWRRTGGAASCKSGDAVAEIGWAGHLPQRSMESDSVAPSSNMHFKRMADMLNACVQDSRSHKLGKDRSPMEFVNWPLANIINSLGLSFDSLRKNNFQSSSHPFTPLPSAILPSFYPTFLSLHPRFQRALYPDLV